MTLRSSKPLLALLVALSLAACGDKPSSESAGTEGASSPTVSTAEAFLLKADLPEAIDIYDVRKKSVGEEVTVYGRVREEVEGMAAFTLIDQSMPYCGQEVACGCTTPWDYCCDTDMIPDASLPIEVRDAKGEILEIDAAAMRLLDLIVVKGKLEKTESGGLVLVTSEGWFRRERPKVADNVQWPE